MLYISPHVSLAYTSLTKRVSECGTNVMNLVMIDLSRKLVSFSIEVLHVVDKNAAGLDKYKFQFTASISSMFSESYRTWFMMLLLQETI